MSAGSERKASEPGTLIGSYRVTESLGTSERALYRATVEGTGEAVCLLELRPDEEPSLSAAAKLEHAHLARVRGVFDHEGTLYLAFEAVPGVTLTARLAEIGKKPTVDAVGSALRVSDALAHLHEVGGVHGFLHTDSVLLDPPERLGPVLSFAPVPADERAFHSPERGETGKPSVADDAWAAAGLLHMMLTGSPPPKEGYADAEALGDAGVEEQSLREALLHGLNSDPARRSRDVRPFQRELARWFVDHAGEEPVLVGPRSTQPPPLPPGKAKASLAVVAAAGVLRRPRRPRIAVLAAGGLAVGLAGAWAFSAISARTRVKVIERPVANAAAAAPKEIDLSEVPVTGQEQAVQLDKTASCVASYLPKGAFGKSPDVGWLCSESDPQKGAQKLRVAIVTAAPKAPNPTDAMKIFSRIGWYDMAAFAVVHAGCCLEQKPLTLPAPSPSCGSMSEALDEIAGEVVGGKSYEEALKRYTAAVQCEVALGRGTAFGRSQRPQPGEDTAFRDLIETIAR